MDGVLGLERAGSRRYLYKLPKMTRLLENAVRRRMSFRCFSCKKREPILCTGLRIYWLFAVPLTRIQGPKFKLK